MAIGGKAYLVKYLYLLRKYLDPGLQCYQCYDKEKVDDDWRGRHETKIDLCHVDFYKMRFETCKLDENMNALNESALVKHACVAEYYRKAHS